MRLIRATVEDVPRILDCAREFCGVIPDCPIDDQHYTSCWRDYVSSHIGVIFLLEHEGQIAGGIGGIHHPDLLTGRKIAVELFWYVREEYRKTMWPVRLLKEFEVWAKMCYCTHISMIHMECSMPKEVASLYQRMGYELFETIYRKKL